MPTMFDSHEEFNEWFSKDIESHAEKQSGIDESKSCFHCRINRIFPFSLDVIYNSGKVAMKYYKPG